MQIWKIKYWNENFGKIHILEFTITYKYFAFLNTWFKNNRIDFYWPNIEHKNL